MLKSIHGHVPPWTLSHGSGGGGGSGPGGDGGGGGGPGAESCATARATTSPQNANTPNTLMIYKGTNSHL